MISAMELRRATFWVTIVLAALALFQWFLTSYLPVYWSGTSFSDVQVPAAISLSAAACVGWVLLIVLENRRDNETRCRKCGHILRGLSEPRCPECGEPI